MTLTNTDEREGSGAAKIIVIVLVLLALGSVAYILFVQLYSFGALPGQAPTNAIQDVPFTGWLDRLLLRLPGLGGYGSELMDNSPQGRWRLWILGWGALMMFSCLALLIVKRVFEPTNDETTVMHLKGDTDTALRAKGGRG